ncbi:MAG: hypothetical protein RIR87_711, partial [Actinomycetota bacterium]
TKVVGLLRTQVYDITDFDHVQCAVVVAHHEP